MSAYAEGPTKLIKEIYLHSDKVGTGNVQRKIGDNIVDVVATLAVAGVVPAIEEFVANAYDADAETVSIMYDGEKDILIIKDDGEGMKPGGGLEDFFRLGDSNKIDHPLTSKGREKIGKFGIATILLKHLCNSYTLETVRDGQKTVLHETFNGHLTEDKPIAYHTEDAGKEPHGTTITMSSLKFDSVSEFRLESLVKSLRWSMPIELPDFMISVNQERVTAAKIDSAQEYTVDKIGQYTGRITGNIYVTKTPSRNAGIHVYVHGRRVGDPKDFLYAMHQRGILRRVVGIIHANGLNDAILFNRSRFNHDHPAYIECKGMIEGLLRHVRQDIEKRVNRQRDIKNADKVRGLVRAIETCMNEKLVSVEKPADGFSLHIGPPLTDGGGVLGSSYDPAKGIVYLSEQDPQLKIGPDFDINGYRAHLENRIAEVIAHATHAARKTNAKTIESFLERKQKIMEELTGNKDSKVLSGVRGETRRKTVKEAQLSTMRMYSIPELADYIGISAETVRYMFKAGALGKSDERIKGEDAILTFTKIERHTSLYDIVRESIKEGQISVEYRKTTDYFNEFGEGVGFISDIGTAEPCFFIMDEFVPDVKSIIESDGFAGLKAARTHGKVITNPLRVLDNTYTTAAEAARKMRLGARVMAQIIDYAAEKRLRLDIMEEGGVKFRYSHLVAARNAMEHEKP